MVVLIKLAFNGSKFFFKKSTFMNINRQNFWEDRANMHFPNPPFKYQKSSSLAKQKLLDNSYPTPDKNQRQNNGSSPIHSSKG